jgi:hypothetical protein
MAGMYDFHVIAVPVDEGWDLLVTSLGRTHADDLGHAYDQVMAYVRAECGADAAAASTIGIQVAPARPSVDGLMAARAFPVPVSARL